MVCLDVVHLTEPELRQELLKLRRRVEKLTALHRLALALLRTSGFHLTGARLPDGRAKMRDLRAVDRARAYLPLRAVSPHRSASAARTRQDEDPTGSGLGGLRLNDENSRRKVPDNVREDSSADPQ